MWIITDINRYMCMVMLPAVLSKDFNDRFLKWFIGAFKIDEIGSDNLVAEAFHRQTTMH